MLLKACYYDPGGQFYPRNSHILGKRLSQHPETILIIFAILKYLYPHILLFFPAASCWLKALKLVSATFIKFLFFHQMIALQKLSKMLSISFKKLFSLSRYWYFCISVLRSFSTCRVGLCFWGWSKINLKVHDIMNCVNKNSITRFVWYLEKEKRYGIKTLSIDGVSDKKHFYRKIMQKMYSNSQSQTSL